MANIFRDFANGFNFFGRGKDQYTQTKFPSVTNIMSMMRDPNWESCETAHHKFLLYNTTAQLKTVIDRRAMMKANGRWVEMKLVNGKPEEVENSDLVTLLENPNPTQSGNECSVQRSMIYDIYGNSIQYINKAMGTPRQIWNLPFPDMHMKKSGLMYKQTDIKKIIERYELRPDNGKATETFETENIIHLRNPNPNDSLWGISKIESLVMELSNLRGAKGFLGRIINSNAMLGILSSEAGVANQMDPKPLDPEAQKLIAQALGMTYGMQEGKQDILQTEANVRWQAMSYPTKDLMLFETITEAFKTIIDAYGMNMNIFSIENQTYENMVHGIRLAYRDTIIPEAENEAIAYTKAFGLDGKTRWLEQRYDHIDLLKEDESEIILRKAQAAQTFLSAGVSSENTGVLTDLELGNVTPPVSASPVV